MEDTNQSQDPQHEAPQGMIRADQGSILSIVFDGLTRSASNFPDDPRERFFMESLAEGDDVQPGEDWEGTFRLVWWYCHRIELEDDGELIDTVRTVLIDDQGNAIKFVSDGIRKDLFRIIAAFGLEKLDPPLPVEVKPVRTRKGFRIFRLLPVQPKPKRATPRK